MSDSLSTCPRLHPHSSFYFMNSFGISSTSHQWSPATNVKTLLSASWALWIETFTFPVQKCSLIMTMNVYPQCFPQCFSNPISIPFKNSVGCVCLNITFFQILQTLLVCRSFRNCIFGGTSLFYSNCSLQLRKVPNTYRIWMTANETQHFLENLVLTWKEHIWIHCCRDM